MISSFSVSVLYTSKHLQESLSDQENPGVPSLQEDPEKEKEEEQIKLELFRGKIVILCSGN